MPPRRSSANTKPPPVMTWGKASPVLIICVLVDALRFMFQWFWIFGPALAALTCTLKWTDTLSNWSFGWLGPKSAATICASGAIGAGIFAFAPMAVFGTVMAMAVGFAGWLLVGFVLVFFNMRIFKENTWWLVGGLGGSLIPLIGSLPFMTFTVGRMYSHQIKIEKDAMKKWQKAQAANQAQTREQQTAQLMQQRAAELQAAEQAAIEEAYAEDRIHQEEQEVA